MKMFNLGLEGGKPEDGSAGVQPEWFYKGDGSVIVKPGGTFMSPQVSPAMHVVLGLIWA